jgi:2-polyprenyl-3-methyl-5-hydroxy-6-metoxy-1,4-benzoquinol methylase
MRPAPSKDLAAMRFYDTIAQQFDDLANPYDTQRRVEVIYDQLLAELDLHGKHLLDAGCGTGAFSCRAVERGADVVSLDIGPRLLDVLGRKCSSRRVAGSLLALPFAEATFDVVVSSEVIEHVSDPPRAISELARVLAPGGLLALTTPNWFWKVPVQLATAMRLRPFRGLENLLGWRELERLVRQAGLVLQAHRGIHLLPFQFRFLHPFLRWLDVHAAWLGPIMINQAILARKVGGHEHG